jgi:hypothetical protein
MQAAKKTERVGMMFLGQELEVCNDDASANAVLPAIVCRVRIAPALL